MPTALPPRLNEYGTPAAAVSKDLSLYEPSLGAPSLEKVVRQLNTSHQAAEFLYDSTHNRMWHVALGVGVAGCYHYL